MNGIAVSPLEELPWLAALSSPDTYPHAVDRIEIVHTHLSVIALTGKYAYKLKKPVDYGFANFSSLVLRKKFCETELRLNQRSAPGMYLDVVPLVQTAEGWRIGVVGQAAEYAVRMSQFPSEARLDRVAAAGGLCESLIDVLADRVAQMHLAAEKVEQSAALDYPRRLASDIADNFKHLPESNIQKRLRELFHTHLSANGGLLGRRASAGCIRDCHGDLHLANICLWRGEPLPFDCIEFNDNLRKIDVLSDAAFLFMDLLERGFRSAAFRFLNRYLETTGDYDGLPAWPIFVAYRAHVRAMVAELTAHAPGVLGEEVVRQETLRDRYLHIAVEALDPRQGKIVLMVGLPGSGKSTLALHTASVEDGIRVRSDVERKRLHRQNPANELYGSTLRERTYRVLLDHARAIVASGMSAILDATYLRRTQREEVLSLAQELNAPLRIVHCDAPLSALQERVRSRREAGQDISDADEQVLMKMVHQWEPFTEQEQALLSTA